jgi:hypothetical protein
MRPVELVLEVHFERVAAGGRGPAGDKKGDVGVLRLRG